MLAHIVAGTEEMLRLTDAAIEHEPSSPTRDFEDRERPWRAVSDGALRSAFVELGSRFITLLESAPTDLVVPFTGWQMSVDDLRRHGRSELSLHRWDLVGDDDIGEQLLSQPELMEHGLKALKFMPTLTEARREPRPGDDLLALWGRSS